MQIVLTSADLVSMPVDCVVNAANQWLQGGGGVDGAIHRAAGPELAEAGRRHVEELGPLLTGQVFVSDGHDLPARWVLHTVGPIWTEHAPGEADRLLGDCYRNCLDEAERLGAASLVFPNISTGVYGFPKERALEVVAGVLFESERDLEIRFSLFDPENRRLYEAHPTLGQ